MVRAARVVLLSVVLCECAAAPPRNPLPQELAGAILRNDRIVPVRNRGWLSVYAPRHSGKACSG